MATMDMGAQGVTEDEAETIEFIKERIWLDPLAVDLQLSLFIAAMNSYRHDTVLRPFPPMFQSDDKEKDIKAMVGIFIKPWLRVEFAYPGMLGKNYCRAF